MPMRAWPRSWRSADRSGRKREAQDFRMLHRGRTRMKVAIMGAGALGGTFGFLLTDAGFDVTLVDVDERKVKSIRDGGLTLTMPDGGKKTLPVKFTSDPAGVGKVD